MPDSWAASAARDHFSEVLDAAVQGRPQSIRRRDGREVVVVSKEYFEKTKPDPKALLLHGGFLDDDDDTLANLYAEARQLLGATLNPLLFSRSDSSNEDYRHGRDQPPEEKD